MRPFVRLLIYCAAAIFLWLADSLLLAFGQGMSYPDALWRFVPATRLLLRLGITLLLLFIGVLLIGLVNPYINKILVDSYINNPEIGAAIASDRGRVFIGFLLVVLLMLAAYVLNFIISIIRNLLMMQVGAKVIVHLRMMVFDKVQELSLSGIPKRRRAS